MATYTDNLRIPLLEQNHSRPEGPENIAKDIIDKGLVGVYIYDTVADADIVIPQVDGEVNDWHNLLIEINDAVTLTVPRNVTFPDYKRVYIFRNSTNQDLTFKTSGTGFVLASGLTAYAMSDGVNMTKITFS